MNAITAAATAHLTAARALVAVRSLRAEYLSTQAALAELAGVRPMHVSQALAVVGENATPADLIAAL